MIKTAPNHNATIIKPICFNPSTFDEPFNIIYNSKYFTFIAIITISPRPNAIIPNNWMVTKYRRHCRDNIIRCYHMQSFKLQGQFFRMVFMFIRMKFQTNNIPATLFVNFVQLAVYRILVTLVTWKEKWLV